MVKGSKRSEERRRDRRRRREHEEDLHDTLFSQMRGNERVDMWKGGKEGRKKRWKNKEAGMTKARKQGGKNV